MFTWLNDINLLNLTWRCLQIWSELLGVLTPRFPGLSTYQPMRGYLTYLYIAPPHLLPAPKIMLKAKMFFFIIWRIFIKSFWWFPLMIQTHSTLRSDHFNSTFWTWKSIFSTAYFYQPMAHFDKKTHFWKSYQFFLENDRIS